MMKITGKSIAILVLAAATFFSLQLSSGIQGAAQIEAGAYRIKSAYSGKYLDVQDGSTENDALCIQSDRRNTASQEWFLRKNSDGSWYVYSINSGKLLEAVIWGDDRIALIQQNDYSGAENQKWLILHNADGSVRFVNRFNEKVLDDPGFSLENQKALIQYSTNGGSNQKWILEKIDNSPAALALLASWNPEPREVTDDGTAIAKPALAIIGVAWFLLTDLLLYLKMVCPKLKIRGKLYFKDLEATDGTEKSIDLGALRKDRITISFNEDDPADFHLDKKGLNFHILLEQVSDLKRYRFLEGFKAFKKDCLQTCLKIRTTEPGILIVGGLIYSNRILASGNIFETGDMLFHYGTEGE